MFRKKLFRIYLKKKDKNYLKRDSNETLIAKTTTDTLYYKINSSNTPRPLEITCTVSNSIRTKRIGESQAKFLLMYIKEEYKSIIKYCLHENSI